MTVHLDISQLLADPRRSGIQRAERELIRHWPGPARLVPCRFVAATGTLHAVPDSVIAILGADAPPGGAAAEAALLAPLLQPGPALDPAGLRVLCAELFLDPDRAAFYCGLSRLPGAAAYFLVYDFLPWLHPSWFPAGAALGLMPYLQALTAVPHLAFISAQTRQDCASRILRRPVHGPVLPLGGDGLGLAPQRFHPGRRSFVMLGTIEARKNSLAVMQAAQVLWQQGVDISLTLIGGIGRDAVPEQVLLRDLAAEPRFRHLRSPSDAAIRAALSEARALLFPSQGEGFGIPPLEALHAGIPVIAAADLPALQALPRLGQIRLPTPDATSIGQAMCQMLDDAAATRLWDEARRCPVPAWRDFAQGVAEWVQAG